MKPSKNLYKRSDIRKTHNSHLGKVKQNRMKFIRKAKIKDYFYKTLEKEGKNLEPPAFYHEIFDFDKSFDDIKIERNLNNLNTKIAESTSFLSHEEIEKEQEEEDNNYKQDKCNDVMSLGVNQKVNKELKRSKNNRKSMKPNPFYKALQERKRIKREKCAEKEVRQQERQLCKQKREAYSSQRNKTKKKLLKCNSKGQPVMKSRIDHILSKIRE